MRQYLTLGIIPMVLFATACSPELTSVEDDSEVLTGALKTANGPESNGMKFNGMKFNGMKFNGMKFNGMKFNGSGTSGADMQGAALGNVVLDKTKFQGTLPDGTLVEGLGFIGATFSATLSDDSTVELGIQNIVQSATDSEIYLYTVRAHDQNGAWVPVCMTSESTPKEVAAIPVAGVWRSDGSVDTSAGQFTFGCRGIGAIAKCVDMGYKPWKVQAHHRACVRMVRADYCGDGVSHTRDGNIVDVFDSKSIQVDDHRSINGVWEFDATWNENGGVCVALSPRPDANKPTCPNVLTKCDISRTFKSNELIKNWVRTGPGTANQSNKKTGGGSQVTATVENIYISSH